MNDLEIYLTEKLEEMDRKIMKLEDENKQLKKALQEIIDAEQMLEYIEETLNYASYSSTPTTWPDGQKTEGAFIFADCYLSVTGKTLKEAVSLHMRSTAGKKRR